MKISWQRRFWSKVNKDCGIWVEHMPTPCWSWIGTIHQGYGIFKLDSKGLFAHRISYELAYGKIPDGLEINHICHNKSCVNPKHLEAVTHQDNMSNPTIRIYCKYGGHLLDKANTGFQPNGNRFCRACANKRARERRAHRKVVI